MSIGCFGKLPIFADFIRHRGSSKEVEAFDRWVQEGIYWSRKKLGDRWDSLFEGMHSYGYFCTRPDRTNGTCPSAREWARP